MKLSRLIQDLQFLAKNSEDPDVEIATGPRVDEWYEVVDVTYEVNFRGNFVVVINTD